MSFPLYRLMAIKIILKSLNHKGKRLRSTRVSKKTPEDENAKLLLGVY